MPETYQPGSRKPIFGQNHKISNDRYAWVITDSGKFIILVGEDKGHGPDVVMYHPRPGKQPNVAIKLTDFTLEELIAFKDLFVTAVEWAQPVVERRDKEATDAWNQGDDSFSRSHRTLPTVVYRKRPELQYSEGVQQRSDGVLEGSGDDREPANRSDAGDLPDRVRGTGDGLAQLESGEDQSEDDCTQAD